MNIRTAALKGAGCVFSMLCAVVTAPAATISVTYALTGTGSGDPTNPPLIGNATGSLLPLGNITWTDMGFPNLSTGALTGTFTMTFANGDTLAGNLHEQLDLSSPPAAVPFTQIIDVTGGTGTFLWYNGTLTGSGTANLVAGTFSTSGSGTLNTTPEPGSVALLAIGLMYLIAYPRWRQRDGKNQFAIEKTDQ